MKIRRLSTIFVYWSVACVYACITINIYFPEAAVKEIADEIVGEVRKNPETKKDEPKRAMQTAEKKSIQAKVFTLVPSAYAQEQEETVSNPKIRALKDTIKERFAELERFYNTGHVGEANDGFLQERIEGDLALKDRALLRQLVKDENEDRKNLYAEVASALDIESSQILRIQKIFAGSWSEQAREGWWIQTEDGEWIQKKEL
ncbi:DUF1318 domain-containing protein [Acidobacteriota bacterium]